ncbi:MAG: adenylate/guanylate cyclase domain-containing protein [Proteobacteria bacterium]|nr:adenylate/guanylate cyclase domain-containing protein [Pseudomonadota bacterium]MDA1022237.1 adenylate/guanylate cyclase domain-containing protein [Pseudomonadota bacterium]
MWKKLSIFIFGERMQAYLPKRVRDNIAAQQVESEKLISFVQLLLVSTFGILYALAPSSAPEAGFQPVPWVLAAYLIFTVFRLIGSCRGRLPDWLLMVSVIMDIGLLMILIWSFHLQYMQPASFYLKAPTMVYVFIFIALRALRFEPRFILISGATAAVGWLILVLYVIYSVPDDPMITRDYVTYLTSNAILIGAEVDKILSILLVTVVLAVAIMRAQRMLNRAVVDSMAAADLSRFVSSEVADRIKTSDVAIQPGDGESKVATVMFTDIEGFSTISEKLNPQELAGMLNEYFGALGDIIREHGGVISQFIGDMLVITYNAVSPNENHAENAVITALGIQDATFNRTFGGATLKTRCGINTGEIVVGAVGTADRLVFTVHGDNVNIAARLESLNKEYGTYILAGENTAKACSDACTFEPVGEVTVRGRATPTKIFTVKARGGDGRQPGQGQKETA